MKKILLSLIAVFLCVSVAVASTDAVWERDRPKEIRGWSVHVEDNDIDASAEFITELDTTFAQLVTEDTIEVVSADANDLARTVTVKGIDNSGNQIKTTIPLTGTNEQTSTPTFRYIDQVEVDKECAGIVTIRQATGDVFITSIPVGELESGMAQHFTGDYFSYITGWKVTSQDRAVDYELRWYPDEDDSLDASDGYKVLDRLVTEMISYDTTESIEFPQQIRLGKNGWIAVYGTGYGPDSTGSVTIQGFDSQF